MSAGNLQQGNSIKELLLFYKEIGADFIEIDRTLFEKKVKSPRPKLKTHQFENPDKSSLSTDSLKKINHDISNCSLCSLYNTKNNFVPGEGSLNPDILFIGEGPGEQEDNSGRPFVGDAGFLLDRIIEKMDYNRDTVYITNIVKCRPPGNRVPNSTEVKACFSFLKRQIGFLKPKIIVCLGKTATNNLLGKELFITKVRGKRFEYNSIPVIPTFHPSYILHQRSKETISKAKWDVWSDMQKVLKILKSLS